MKHEGTMRLAVAAAKKASQDGGVAIGAVLVDASGNVVATGESLVGVTHDPTAHAEVNCIRAASQKLGDDDLYDYTLYCTLEPCRMCLSAAAWAKIRQVYFGAYRKDVGQNLFDTKGTPGDEQEASRMNLRENATMRVTGGILEKECAELLAGYNEQPSHG